MKYSVRVKNIDWLDTEVKEGDVCVELGSSLYWGFCYSCDFVVGERTDIEIYILESGDISFETMFSYNRDKEMKIVPFPTDRTAYYSYGRVVSVKPIVVDCGDMQFDLGDFTTDERVIGEYVYFVVNRLDIHKCMKK